MTSGRVAADRNGPGSGGGSPAGGAEASAPGRLELLGDLDRPRAWMLLAGGVPQSHVDLDDPLHLELEYIRVLGHLIDLAAPAGAPLRVLHLGGGGLTLARYVAATRRSWRPSPTPRWPGWSGSGCRWTSPPGGRPPGARPAAG
jgi:hypothetical protein